MQHTFIMDSIRNVACLSPPSFGSTCVNLRVMGIRNQVVEDRKWSLDDDLGGSESLVGRV